MKACVATGEMRQMEYREVPEPTVGPGEVKLKTICSLICGSDLEYLEGIPTPIEPGLIRGHEFVAEISEIGEGVTGWELGDRAVPISYTGNYGCWADSFVTSTRGVQKVPDHVSNEDAVFVEAMHTGLGAVEAANLKPGMSVVIIGAGKIGLLAMLTAKLQGAAPIVMVDVEQSRIDRALELGADYVFNSSEVDAVSEVKKLFRREGLHEAFHGADAVIEAVRQGPVLYDAINMCRQGAPVIIAGWLPESAFNPGILMNKQTTLHGIMAGRHGESRKNGEIALHMLAHNQIDPKPLLTGSMQFKDIQKAIDASYALQHLSIYLTP